MNRSVKEAIADVAAKVWEQYQLGNKSDARSIFKKLPVARRPLCVLYIVEQAADIEDVYTFVESVTE